MNDSYLLREGKLGRLSLRNRIFYSAMDLRSAQHGIMSGAAERCLLERALHGPALVSLPGLMVRPRENYGRSPSIAEDGFIPHLAALVRRLHDTGAKVSFPLYERGTRHENGQAPIGPSPIRFAFEKAPCRPMTVEEIRETARLFGQAARRAREAGADTLELHACTGKLLNMFVSPYSNRRTDEYGGSVRNRARFLLETLEEIRHQVGKDMPVILRLGVEDLVEGGLTLEEGLETARLAAPLVDALLPVSGTQERIWNITPCFLHPHGYMRPVLRRVREAVPLPLVAMGKLGAPRLAEAVISEGEADFIALGRPLLADPLWLSKVREGREKDIRPCTGCLNCLTFALRKDLPEGAGCTVNPDVLREDSVVMSPTRNPRRILVAGGGLAGMTAASMLAEQGHDVLLCESSAELGGQWKAASAGPEKTDYLRFLTWLKSRLNASGAKVRMNCTVTAELIRGLKPDMCIVATGAGARPLPVEAAPGGPLVIQGRELLEGSAVAEGRKAVVAGGRYIGLEAGLRLAEMGMSVDIVDAADIGHGTNPRIFGPYRDKLVKNGARFFPNSPLLRLTADGVDIAHGGSLLHLEADTVVLALGSVSEQSLMQALTAEKIPFIAAGDCRRIGDALYAVREGADAALAIQKQAEGEAL